VSNIELSKVVVKRLQKLNKTLSVAESITAGGIANQITQVPGASKVFFGGVIAYSDESKVSQLAISKADIKKFTSVSEQVAIEMAKSVRKKFKTDLLKKSHLRSHFYYRGIEK